MNKQVPSRKLFILYSVILILMAISMRSTNNMVVTTVPLYSKYILNFSYIGTALVTAIIYLGTVLATLLINPIMGSILRKRMFIIANFVLTGLMISYYFSGAISVFMISFVIGLAYGIILPNIVTSATLYPDRTAREKLLGIYSVGLSFSLVFGPSLETYLLTLVSYRTLFLFFAPLGLIGIVTSFFMEFPKKWNNYFRKGKT